MQNFVLLRQRVRELLLRKFDASPNLDRDLRRQLFQNRHTSPDSNEILHGDTPNTDLPACKISFSYAKSFRIYCRAKSTFCPCKINCRQGSKNQPFARRAAVIKRIASVTPKRHPHVPHNKEQHTAPSFRDFKPPTPRQQHSCLRTKLHNYPDCNVGA